MSVPGGYFVTEEFFSPARFNRKTNTHLTGAEIAALNPTYPNQIVVCTATGSGFTVDTMYMRNTANTTWIGGSGGIHTHDANTDAAGGLFSEITRLNLAKVLWENIPSPTTGQFRVDVASGGGVSDVHPQLNLSTGTTSGWAHIGRAGVGLSFASNQRFLARLYVTHNTNLTARLGVVTERVDETGDHPARKYGLEACDSASTARNWDVFSSDGTTRTATVSTESVAQASARAYRLDYTVATDVKFYVNGSTTPNVTKTSNVPGGNVVNGGRTIGAGIKHNSGPAKNMFISGMAFSGVPSTTAWG
jgi:hypothetical protein